MRDAISLMATLASLTINSAALMDRRPWVWMVTLIHDGKCLVCFCAHFARLVFSHSVATTLHTHVRPSTRSVRNQSALQTPMRRKLSSHCTLFTSRCMPFMHCRSSKEPYDGSPQWLVAQFAEARCFSLLGSPTPPPTTTTTPKVVVAQFTGVDCSCFTRRVCSRR
jgi:hypothetical protein